MKVIPQYYTRYVFILRLNVGYERLLSNSFFGRRSRTVGLTWNRHLALMCGTRKKAEKVLAEVEARIRERAGISRSNEAKLARLPQPCFDIVECTLTLEVPTLVDEEEGGC